MDGRRFNKGTKGNKGGGSYVVQTADAFFKALDSRLPFVIQSVAGAMDWADEQLALAPPLNTAIGLQRLKIDAAKVLIAKAPDRHVGGDGEAIKFEVMWQERAAGR